MDVLNADMILKNEAQARKGRRSKAKASTDYDDDEAVAFHFIAFVPALGKLWKFDGLERQPHILGECAQDDWLDLAKPNLLTRMADYEDGQIEFSILGLVRDPLLNLVEDLAVNVKSQQMVHDRLQDGSGNGKGKDALYEEATLGPDESLGLTQDAIDQATVPAEEKARMEKKSREVLLEHRQSLWIRNQELQSLIREEQESRRQDMEYAMQRRFDYGPAVRRWLKLLQQKRKIGELVGNWR